ncbi:MAG TPA: hypothetical protein VH519_13610 [Hyphomicrobiaceae bacterium]|jgi:hypothetical protein
MQNHVLPAELQAFLENHIESIAQLEALLLLAGTPGVVWDPRAAAKRLYIGEHEALGVLAI